MSTEETITLYEAIGGEETIRKLVARFYDLMDTLPKRRTAARSIRRASSVRATSFTTI